jgi:hypothetical protein
MIIEQINDYIRELGWKIFGYQHYIKKRFVKRHGYELNLEDPRTFSDKIQWLKVYGNLEQYARFVDKYTVKEFVKKMVGEKFIIPTIGIYEKVSDINFNVLPKSFVIKATHGSHWNIIVKDKQRINQGSLIKEMEGWLKLNYYLKGGEPQYKNVQRRIIIEKYIEDLSGDLKDYKFFCFNGVPRYIQVDVDRFTDHQRDIYNLDWEKVPFKLVCKNVSHPVPKPEKLEQMIEISRTLSQSFPFVRVDLYYTNGRIYFGELTFTPHSGLGRIIPNDYDYKMGKWIKLPCL